MPNCRDADLLQRLVREARKNRLVNLVLAERRLIFTKAETSEPGTDINGSRPCWSWLMIVQAELRV
jgi:hypothetical protein